MFVPAATSKKKVAQLQGYGATVHSVAGSRAEAAAAAIDHVEATGAFYASHVYNPLFHHGTKTFAFELWEQLGGHLPATVLVPAGNGTLLIGASIGFKELAAAGLSVVPGSSGTRPGWWPYRPSDVRRWPTRLERPARAGTPLLRLKGSPSPSPPVWSKCWTLSPRAGGR